MKTINVLVQIKVDEKVLEESNPDFKLLYGGDVEEFVEVLLDSIETECEIDGMPYDSLEDLGYSIEIVADAAMLNFITYSKN